ncbi:hypothetical protein HYPSUDRAFT_80374 [Hypholoma sublateritium FD-334 SS-4]|uniref:Uncharacterized protein n=1 Tax=Hypholoma sublateritium (strain FD-334 SS-4) TaxID=945553 RepID=A0A0D2P5Q7_HYPSF|nr:hypothetical protein HYPSUDRAFT_80374 [Hypholoma sublateritium FD-334 SS-4]
MSRSYYTTQQSEYSSNNAEWTPNELWFFQALKAISTASEADYTTQQSAYSSSDDSASVLPSFNATRHTQNLLPDFAPGSSTLLNALGPSEPTPTFTAIEGIKAYPIPPPTRNDLYPAGPSIQNSGWGLPAYTAVTLSRDNSPVSESSAGLLTPPSGPPNRWPSVAQESLGYSTPLLTNYFPEDLPPEQNGRDMTHATWNVSGHSSVSQSVLNDEEIVVNNIVFGLPTSTGQPYTGEISAGDYAPYALQAQSSNGSDDTSGGSRRGKRKADDSPWADDCDALSYKRACVPVSGEHSVMGDHQASSSSKSQILSHQDESLTDFTPLVVLNMASAPENHHAPALGKNGSRVAKKATKEYKFYTHVGSVNSKGDASTRKRRIQDQGFFPDTIGAPAEPVSLRWPTVAFVVREPRRSGKRGI